MKQARNAQKHLWADEFEQEENMQTATMQRMLTDVEQMSLSELEQFVSQVMAISARRKAPILSHTESELLLKINRGLPLEMRKRSQTLNAKR
jgi:hypothetical protein